MEQSYVSAAFFRHLTKERLQRHQAEQLLADGRPQPQPLPSISIIYLYLVMIGLLYKAYPDGCQQVLLRLRPHPMRGHQLLSLSIINLHHCMPSPHTKQLCNHAMFYVTSFVVSCTWAAVSACFQSICVSHTQHMRCMLAQAAEFRPQMLVMMTTLMMMTAQYAAG